MNRHIPEDPSRTSDVFARGRSRVAANDDYLFQIADLTLGDTALHCGEGWIKPSIEPQHNLGSTLVNGFAASSNCFDLQVNWLLAQYRQAFVYCACYQIDVSASRRTDYDSGDVVAREHFFWAGHRFGSGYRCEFLSAVEARLSADYDFALRTCSDVVSVDRAASSGTESCETDRIALGHGVGVPSSEGKN